MKQETQPRMDTNEREIGDWACAQYVAEQRDGLRLSEVSEAYWRLPFCEF